MPETNTDEVLESKDLALKAFIPTRIGVLYFRQRDIDPELRRILPG